MSDVNQMRDEMMKIMKQTLYYIREGHYTLAERNMETVQKWVAVMKKLMPEQANETFDAFVKEIEAQVKGKRNG